MKLPFICLIAISIFSCNNNPATSEQAKTDTAIKAKAPEPVDTGHGVRPSLLPETDTAYLLNATYCNTRYGFCISYASEDVQMEAESDSGDGCIFTNKEGEELGRIYRRANADPETSTYPLKEELESDIANLRKESRDKPEVDYNLSGTFYELLVKADGKIYYRKGIMLGNDLAKVIFEYDVQQEKRYGVIAAAMAHSFRQ